MVSGSGAADYDRNGGWAFVGDNHIKDEADSSRRRRQDDRSRSHSPPRLVRWERRLRDAKKSHRPRLKNWGRDRFGVEGSRAEKAFEALSWEGGARHGVRGIPRERRDDLTPRDFWEHYEKRRLPVVVSGIPSQEGWRAEERWTLEQLHRRWVFSREPSSDGRNRCFRYFGGTSGFAGRPGRPPVADSLDANTAIYDVEEDEGQTQFQEIESARSALRSEKCVMN